MSAEEFWKDDPQLFVSYRTSFINKKKREIEEQDYLCWLQGLYIYDGNNKLSASFKQFIGNLVSGLFKGNKDKTKIETYPTKPYLEIKKEEEQLKQQNKKKQNKKYEEFHNSLIYYGTLKQQYVNKMTKKGE